MGEVAGGMAPRIAGGYVELIRNLPLLLQLLFWYNAVLKALPGTRESFAIPGGGFLNNRGLFLPQPMFEPAARFALIALTSAERDDPSGGRKGCRFV